MGLAQFDGTCVARRQRLILALAAAVPDRAHGMDYMPRRQSIAQSDFGVAGLAAVKGAAFGQKLRARGAMDGPVDTAATKQGRIGGVDDGVNAQGRNVG